MDAQNPASPAEAALVSYLCLIEIPDRGTQGNHDCLRRHDDFQMTANVLIESVKAAVQMLVIVGRQRTGLGVQSEGAQSSRQTRHLAEKLFGMAMFGKQDVPQRSETRIDRVQEPELRDMAGGESSLEFSLRLLLLP